MNLPTADYMEKRYEAVTETGCWLWTGYVGGGGYGRVSIGNRKSLAAHRVMWEMHNGAIPEGLVVCHKCDTPACINPSHLFVGTQGDNVLDAVRKKRYPPKAVKLVCHAGHPYETTGVKRKRCRQCSKDQRNRSYHKKVRRLRNGTQPGKDMERMKESTIEALRALEKKWRGEAENLKSHVPAAGLLHCADELAALLTTRQEVAPVANAAHVEVLEKLDRCFIEGTPTSNAIRAAIAQMRGQSWQPIETAPKDLGSFLVWCPDRKNTYMVTANAGHGFRVFGGYELCEEATHWQPRPDPPKEPAE